MMHFCTERNLLLFTDSLSELVSSGLSLQTALEVMEKLKSKNHQVVKAASFLHDEISDGVQFSLALKMTPQFAFPDWYVAYIAVSEECGALKAVLLHLKTMLCHKRENSEKIFSVLLYPLIVILLTAVTGFVSVFYFLPSFSAFFDEVTLIQKQAVRSMIFADFLLLLALGTVFLLVKKTLSESPCVNVFRTMGFLGEASVPTLSAVSCAFSFAGKNRKVARALLSVRNRLLEGEKLPSCFGSCFLEAGFKAEGILLSENLSLDAATGKNKGFEKTADVLAAANARSEKLLFAFLQPLILLISAVYIAFILNSAVMPYLTNFGGL